MSEGLFVAAKAHLLCRRENRGKANVKLGIVDNSVGFLLGGYRDKYYYFEVIWMAKKVALAAASVMPLGYQTWAVQLVLVVSMGLHVATKAFQNHKHNVLEILVESIILFTSARLGQQSDSLATLLVNLIMLGVLAFFLARFGIPVLLSSRDAVKKKLSCCGSSEGDKQKSV